MANDGRPEPGMPSAAPFAKEWQNFIVFLEAPSHVTKIRHVKPYILFKCDVVLV